MRRREFLLVTGLGALAGAAHAQPRAVRIGVLSANRREGIISTVLLRTLAEIGLREGEGMTLEFRSADGVAARYPQLARELIASRCDLIFVLGSEEPARALQQTHSAIPIVLLATNYDPVEKGLVSSLRRPGGNMTGVYFPIAIAAKRLELAREILPHASRFLVLSDVDSRDQLQILKKAAAARGVELTIVEYQQQPYDFAAAFQTGRHARVQAFIGLSSAAFVPTRGALNASIESARMPAIVSNVLMDQPGFLAGYTFDLAKGVRRAVGIGVRILKGAKPADIPIEQADEFELVVNLKTAKALGVKIPDSVLVRATRLIE